jgi:iduronate 2-sulfatase
MVPLLDEPNRPWKKAAFTQISQKGAAGRAARTERYRYIRWTGDEPDEELYDHEADPHEFTNLARQPQQNQAALTMMRTVLDGGWKVARA